MRPSFSDARNVSINVRLFGKQTHRRSPRVSPRSLNTRARRLLRASSSPNVSVARAPSVASNSRAVSARWPTRLALNRSINCTARYFTAFRARGRRDCDEMFAAHSANVPPARGAAALFDEHHAVPDDEADGPEGKGGETKRTRPRDGDRQDHRRRQRDEERTRQRAAHPETERDFNGRTAPWPRSGCGPARRPWARSWCSRRTSSARRP